MYRLVNERRKTEEDEQKMREFLGINDLVVAEIKSVSKVDFNINLHLRHEKFGKLQKGALVSVNNSLIKRMTKHIIEYEELEFIFAVNGFIWIKSLNSCPESLEKVAKFRNIIRILDDAMIPMYPTLLIELFTQFADVKAKDLLFISNRLKISESVKASIIARNN